MNQGRSSTPTPKSLLQVSFFLPLATITLKLKSPLYNLPINGVRSNSRFLRFRNHPQHNRNTPRSLNLIQFL
ncbi:hypothetical protein L2E82_38145 [Cichorium intybus]|uniref:Uncharacterized protein n=1 Tax=Cichorium intybus TaxID=13427 RepID=A0ACB9AGT7_CICIN|nr:hypothetical protein L2E82_38145 [Cichorium intybus]